MRKRSLRKEQAFNEAIDHWTGDPEYHPISDVLFDAVVEDRCSFYGLRSGSDVAHSAYVRGVKDALEAIDADVRGDSAWA